MRASVLRATTARAAAACPHPLRLAHHVRSTHRSYAFAIPPARLPLPRYARARGPSCDCALQVHGGAAAKAEATQRFHKIVTAHDILSDVLKRRAYDESIRRARFFEEGKRRRQHNQPQSPQPSPSHPPPPVVVLAVVVALTLLCIAVLCSSPTMLGPAHRSSGLGSSHVPRQKVTSPPSSGWRRSGAADARTGRPRSGRFDHNGKIVLQYWK